MIPKFRAWHHELGRMMLVSSMYFQDGEIEEFELNDTLMADYIPADTDEVTIMQSTGLKDKNGKEIFEGDIIKNGIDIMSIKRHDTLGFYIDFKGKVEFLADGADLDEFEEDAKEIDSFIEIIGNIYEKPEFFK